MTGRRGGAGGKGHGGGRGRGGECVGGLKGEGERCHPVGGSEGEKANENGVSKSSVLELGTMPSQLELDMQRENRGVEGHEAQSTARRLHSRSLTCKGGAEGEEEGEPGEVEGPHVRPGGAEDLQLCGLVLRVDGEGEEEQLLFRLHERLGYAAAGDGREGWAGGADGETGDGRRGRWTTGMGKRGKRGKRGGGR